MDVTLKNRFLFWALAIVPLAGGYVISQTLGADWFVLYLLFYLFIYRPLLDTQRLMSLNAIEEKDAWRFFVPLLVDRIRYFRTLWFG